MKYKTRINKQFNRWLDELAMQEYGTVDMKPILKEALQSRGN